MKQKPIFTNASELPITLSVQELASFLGISRTGAYRLSRTARFPAVRIGRRILIPRDRFLRWLNSLPGGNDGEA